MKQLTEVPAYNASMLLTDLGGVLGLFLGLSLWGIRDIAVKVMNKFWRE